MRSPDDLSDTPLRLGRLGRLEGIFWGQSLLWRRPIKRLATALSILRYRWRSLKQPLPPRLVATRLPDRDSNVHASGEDSRGWQLFTRGEVPTIAVEAVYMAAAAENLEMVIAGAHALGSGPSGELSIRALEKADVRLLRRPRAGKAPALLGRLVPLLGEEWTRQDEQPTPLPLRRSGPLLLRPDIGDGVVIRREVRDVEGTLAQLPPVEGPDSTIFLLPYLAVGGAERLLFDLLEALVEDCDRRYLVVTLDPHVERLGQTVDRCQRLTPFVFTLGDWMPREATWSALRHLIRRFKARTLFSWNGTVDFFDRVHELRRDFPDLLILSQLYHHRGGWAARTSPALIRSVDRHIAVNRAIAGSLERRGTPRERIALIHHGVAVPPERRSREERRIRHRDLGIPEKAELVIGTFIRLHEQKRPLDILAIARRFDAERVFFLLVGGGPMDATIDAELAREPLPHLIRHGMTREPLPLYDAIDVCLMTSSYEGLPVFLLDGLARGLPGVAPAVGDIPLLFAEGGGLSVAQPGDIDGLEAAIRQLMEAGERERRGTLGRQSVETRFGLKRYRADYRRELRATELKTTYRHD